MLRKLIGYFWLVSIVVLITVFYQFKSNLRVSSQKFYSELKVSKVRLYEVNIKQGTKSKLISPIYFTGNPSGLDSTPIFRNKEESELDRIRMSFVQSYNEDLTLGPYINGYNQIYSIFFRLGTLFKIMRMDMKEKLDKVAALRNSDNSQRDFYEKVEVMMLHEIQMNNETGEAMIGSRTVLRLHRALKFIMLFLEGLDEISDNDGVSSIASKAYADSLAKHHSWLLRQAASIAMFTLPAKTEFMNRIYPDTADRIALEDKIRLTVEAIKNIYFSIDDLYNKYRLYDLP